MMFATPSRRCRWVWWITRCGASPTFVASAPSLSITTSAARVTTTLMFMVLATAPFISWGSWPGALLRWSASSSTLVSIWGGVKWLLWFAGASVVAAAAMMTLGGVPVISGFTLSMVSVSAGFTYLISLNIGRRLARSFRVRHILMWFEILIITYNT